MTFDNLSLEEIAAKYRVKTDVPKACDVCGTALDAKKTSHAVTRAGVLHVHGECFAEALSRPDVCTLDELEKLRDAN